MQKYPHIVESYACTLKCLNASTLSPFTYKAIQWVCIDLYSSRFNMYVPSFILVKLFLEQTSLNLGSFW